MFWWHCVGGLTAKIAKYATLPGKGRGRDHPRARERETSPGRAGLPMMSVEVTVFPQCRVGVAPAASLRGRRSGSLFDHRSSPAGRDGRVPFLACGHHRVQLAQQGGDGSVGLPTVELAEVEAEPAAAREAVPVA